MEKKDTLQNLEALHKLFQQGVIAEDEYQTAKENLLAESAKEHIVVRSEFVWFLAFAPLIGLLLEQFIAQLVGINVEDLFFITIVLNVLLAELDCREMKKKGFKTGLLDNSWLIPAYLYERARLLKEMPIYLLVWLVCFGLLFVL